MEKKLLINFKLLLNIYRNVKYYKGYFTNFWYIVNN